MSQVTRIFLVMRYLDGGYVELPTPSVRGTFTEWDDAVACCREQMRREQSHRIHTSYRIDSWDGDQPLMTYRPNDNQARTFTASPHAGVNWQEDEP